jgi:hypothetical protein
MRELFYSLGSLFLIRSLFGFLAWYHVAFVMAILAFDYLYRMAQIRSNAELKAVEMLFKGKNK